MRELQRLSVAIALSCGLALFPGCQDGPPAPHVTEADALEAQLEADGLSFKHGRGVRMPFADLEMFIEFNSTDNDAGVHVVLDAVGWKRVRATDPTGHGILDIIARSGLKQLGLTELRFESAEPSPEEVLALFQPGDYVFHGLTIDGKRLHGVAEFSQDLPPAPTFTPADGSVVDPDNLIIEWDAIPGVTGYEVIVSNEDAGTTLSVELPPSATSFTVPSIFVEPHTEYKAEILAIGENGNKTITENAFSTGS